MNLKLLAIGVTLALLTGCGAPQSPIRSLTGSAIDATSAPSLSSANDPWLYVSGLNDVVNVYDVAQSGNPLVLSVTQGISKPAGLKVDDQGALYVANTGNDTVAEYPFGQSTPSFTISVTAPQDTAVDPLSGDLYVDTRSQPPEILVYKKGHTEPSRDILSKLFVNPAQMLFDRFGTLFIADNQNGVLMLKRRTHRVTSLNLQGLDGCTTGIALNEHTSDLYVSDCDSGIQVYKLGNEYPLRSLDDENSYSDYIALGAIGKREDLFAPNVVSSTVAVYHANGTSSFEVIATGSVDALGVAVKPAGVALLR